MFVNNGKISDRQTFRLYIFDLIGIGTLLLPPYLAKLTGCDGIFCILLGSLAGYIYLRYLGFLLGKMKTDAGTFLQQQHGKIVQYLSFGFVCIHSIFTAGFCAYVFGNAMKHTLIKDESFTLILFITIILAAYAVGGGIESRARVYEVLFWVILVPYIAMMLFTIKDFEMEYVDTFFISPTQNLLEGCYLVFLFLTPLFFSIFLLGKKEEKSKKFGTQMIRIVTKSLLISTIIFLGSYILLLGNFGANSLSEMRYPVVTLMSTVQFKGNFLKRMDALMLAVWFFTLFALINFHMHYGADMMKKIKSSEGSKRVGQIIVTAILVYIIAYAMNVSSSFVELFLDYYSYIAVPIMIIGPALLLIKGNLKNKN